MLPMCKGWPRYTPCVDSLNVRPAILLDAKGIAAIHMQTWQSAYKGHMPDSFLSNFSLEETIKTWTGKLEQTEPGTQYFVAELDGMIVGFCTVGPSRDDDRDITTGELDAIYVGEQYEQQGAGSRLLTKGLEWLRGQGYKKATLWVLESNAKARAWYEAKGWEPDGKTKIEPREGFEMHLVRYVINL